MSTRTNTRQTTRQIWAAPIALAVASAFGLTAALLSDGIGEILSWIALAAPTAVVLWFSLRPKQNL